MYLKCKCIILQTWNQHLRYAKDIQSMQVKHIMNKFETNIMHGFPIHIYLLFHDKVEMFVCHTAGAELWGSDSTTQ